VCGFANPITIHGIDNTNPLPFFGVKQRIEAALSAHAGRFVIVPVPNITHVIYGRDVGYVVERIVLDDTIEAISATHLRPSRHFSADVNCRRLQCPLISNGLRQQPPQSRQRPQAPRGPPLRLYQEPNRSSVPCFLLSTSTRKTLSFWPRRLLHKKMLVL
jgi:hypothetical protein